MSISLSQEIPEIFDPADPESMRQWMVAVKQCIEEITRKAQSLQLEVRVAAPAVTELTEGESVRATVGGLNYIYTKMNGTILRTQIS